LHFGVAPSRIVSAYRSREYQKELQKRWDAGNRAGLVVRPADKSTHTERVGFDLDGDAQKLQFYGWLASYLPGVRWGGTFTTPDRVHFDLGAV
jgi:hypothetical protein